MRPVVMRVLQFAFEVWGDRHRRVGTQTTLIGSDKTCAVAICGGCDRLRLYPQVPNTTVKDCRSCSAP